MHDPMNPRVIVVSPEDLRALVAEAVREAMGQREDSLRLLSPDEAGAVLGVTGRTVLKWAKNEGLPHRELGPKVVRFVESEILEWGARRPRKVG